LLFPFALKLAGVVADAWFTGRIELYKAFYKVAISLKSIYLKA